MLSQTELSKHSWHEKFDSGISELQTRMISFWKRPNEGTCYITIITRKPQISNIPDNNYLCQWQNDVNQEFCFW